MALPEAKVDVLIDLLQRSTARITPPGGGLPAGAAFFVSERLLVTNRHVVGPHPAAGDLLVTVTPYGGGTVDGRVLAQSTVDPDLDVVLIEVPPVAGRSAVVLHTALHNGDYLVAGYPKESYFQDLGPGVEVVPRVPGHPRLDLVTEQPQLLRLTNMQVRPGFSGGPVVSMDTGAVVAVTVYSENPQDDLGGGALPMARAIAAYPELEELAAEPPEVTGRFRELLGRDLWEGMNLVWDRKEQLDVYLSGNRSSWRIGVRPNDQGPERTVRDLGDDMSEVLVQWARSSGRRDESEVRLLGRLLSAALFPPAVADKLPHEAQRGGNPVLIRLHVDPQGPLADLPWEFATHPGDAERFLAATDGYALVRVNPDAPVGAQRRTPATPGHPLRVLAIVVQPEDTTRWPTFARGRDVVSWPRGDLIGAALRDTLTAQAYPNGEPVFDVDLLVNPTLSALVHRAGTPVDVVHYIGFGYQDPGARASASLEDCSIAFSVGSGTDDLRYHRALAVLDQLKPMGASLGVFQFGTPSLDLFDVRGNRPEPIGPAMLAAATYLGLDAMVSTRPLHPLQYQLFNEWLYTNLAAGEPVEQAVQRGRQVLMTEAPIDFAGFGWFAATTGNNPRLRMVASSGSDSTTDASGRKRPTPASGG